MTRRPASIAEAFILYAGRTPNKLCLRFEGDEWTYGRLHRRAADFAAALRTREIEEVLGGCPGVAEAAVVGMPDPEFGEQDVAVVVRDNTGLTAREIGELLPRSPRGLQKAASGSVRGRFVTQRSG